MQLQCGRTTKNVILLVFFVLVGCSANGMDEKPDEKLKVYSFDGNERRPDLNHLDRLDDGEREKIKRVIKKATGKNDKLFINILTNVFHDPNFLGGQLEAPEHMVKPYQEELVKENREKKRVVKRYQKTSAKKENRERRRQFDNAKSSLRDEEREQLIKRGKEKFSDTNVNSKDDK